MRLECTAAKRYPMRMTKPAAAQGEAQAAARRLPKQTGGAHEDKSKRPFRKEKHKKKWAED